MKKPSVIVFSNPLDVHISYMTKHLNEKEVLVIDPLGEMLEGQGVDYKFADNRLQIFHKGEELKDIKSVWYRKTSRLDPELFPLAKENFGYARSALSTQASSLAYLFPDAFWMSDRRAVWRANSKPLQAIYASKLGMNVPETLFASTRESAEEFVGQHDSCIAKTQATEFPPNVIVFAKLIHAQDNLDFQGLRYDPYIFQQYIDPDYELRVTVVGNKVFAATMHGDETDGVKSSYRDWRYAYVNDTFKAKEAVLPRVIAKQCVALVKELGLAYGAIDLIVDKFGKVWFLEINPNGQWAFVEEDTGQPIGAAIAELLLNPVI